MASDLPSAKTCKECGASLLQRNKSGYCGKHWSKNSWRVQRERDPGLEAKRVAGIRLKYASDPEFKLRIADTCRRIAKLPQAVEARRHMVTSNRLWERGNAAQPAGSPSRVLASKRASDTKLAWCPPELREDYRQLRRKKLPIDEAKEIILAQHEKNMREFRRSIGA